MRLRTRRIFYILAIISVSLIALGLRMRAVQLLPIDYDEDDYFSAGQHYAAAIREGNLGEIINYSYNYEHPPLTKLVYGLAILPLPQVPQVPEQPSTASPAHYLPKPHFTVDRTVSAVEGTLEVLALSIINPIAGLMLVYTAFSMPFCIWNMRAGFQSISRELEESAFLDGANPFTAFLRITLPLALPSIGVAALVAFLTGYSEFAMAWLFIDSSKNVTLAMSLSGMIGQFSSSWNSLAALAIMMTIPVVILFYALQRYLLDRLLIGRMEDETL